MCLAQCYLRGDHFTTNWLEFQAYPELLRQGVTLHNSQAREVFFLLSQAPKAASQVGMDISWVTDGGPALKYVFHSSLCQVILLKVFS